MLINDLRRPRPPFVVSRGDPKVSQIVVYVSRHFQVDSMIFALTRPRLLDCNSLIDGALADSARLECWIR
jgi:hypothetical protein